MAQQYTPEEIQEIFDAYNQAIAAGVPVSRQLAEQMKDATKGVKDYTYNLNRSLKDLGQATKGLAKDLYDGKKGASVFNNSMESAADAASNVAVGFGPLGVAVGLVIKALTFFVTTANKQSDKLYETFQNMSRTGTVGAKGMSDVFDSMKRMGYTFDELDKMTATFAENSKDLALFGGTAAMGGKQLTGLVEGLESSRVGLFNLGMTVDDITKASAGYYKQLGRQGRLQEATSQGALAYIKEMETLTRLTGLQRKELEDQLEEAENMDEFYAAWDDMTDAAQRNTKEILGYLKSVDPSGKSVKGFIASINGMMGGTEEQADMLYRTNGQMLEWGKSVREGTMTSTQYKEALGEAARGNYQTAKDMSKIGNNIFGGLKTLKLLDKAGAGAADAQARAREEIEGLISGTDAATDAQSRARNSQINSSNAMQDLVNFGVSPVTKAMAHLADVVDNLTRLLPGGGSKKGYGQKGTGTGGGAAAAAGAGALAGGTAGSFLGPVGAAAGATVGGLLGYAEYQIHGGAGDTAKGLKIKSDEATAGGETKPGLYALAQKIQNELGGNLHHFSAFNDKYHQGLDYSSAHTRGTALDFTLNDPSTAAQVAQMVRSMPGVSKVLDEYNNPSSKSTAGHIHAEINGAAGFRGMLSGPMSGYSPNMLMHGNEELSIRPMGGTVNDNASATEGSIGKLIDRVDDLIALSKSQLYVNEKILKYQQ